MYEPSHPSSSLVEFVPLMRSPATWIPAPVTLPPDIHPLPDDISAYFVYPYTLEEFVLHPSAPHKSHAERISKIHEEHEIRLKYLREREEEKLKKRREALRKVAPGWEPPEDDGAVLSFADGDGTEGRTSRDGERAQHRRSGILEPTRKSQPLNTAVLVAEKESPAMEESADVVVEEVKLPRDVMDDLVEGLARMDELESRSGQ